MAELLSRAAFAFLTRNCPLPFPTSLRGGIPCQQNAEHIYMHLRPQNKRIDLVIRMLSGDESSVFFLGPWSYGRKTASATRGCANDDIYSQRVVEGPY